MRIPREKEIEKLENVWRNTDKKGKTVIVLGPLGIGKHSILMDFARKIGVDFLHYRCERSDEHIPLGSLRRFMSVYYPDLLRKIKKTTKPEKVYDLLLETVSEGKKIVYFEGINYADYLSLKFVTYFALNAPKGVMLAVSYPTEAEKEDLSSVLEHLIMEDLASVVLVEPISKENIRKILAGTPLENRVDEIVEKSRGNLLYMKFLLQYWQKTHDVKVFEDPRDAIAENYALLSDMEKETLRIGALMGNMFFQDVVEDITGKKVEEYLQKLVAEGWITRFSQRYGNEVYRGYVFTHEFIRDTVESMVDHRSRREIHDKIARSIERHNLYFTWEKAYELAHHYYEAKNTDKGIKYLNMVADLCMNIYDFRSAVYYLKQLEEFMNILDHHTERVNLYGKLSHALTQTGELKESVWYYDKAVAYLNVQKADILRKIGKFKDALNLVKDACTVKDPYIKMISYKVEAEVFRRMGLYTEALNSSKKHLNLAKKEGNEREIAIAYKTLGNIWLSMMDYAKGEKYYRMALEIFKKLKDLWGISAIYNNMGIVYSYRGQLEKAKQFYLKSLRLDERMRDYDGMGTAYNNIGTIYEELGEYTEAIDAYQKSIKYNLLTGSMDGLEYAYSNLASLYMGRGRFTEAIKYADREINIAKKTGSVKFQISGYMNLSNIYCYMGNYEESVEYARKAWSIAEKHRNYYDGIDAYYYMARAYHAMGDDSKCQEHVEFVLKHYQKWGIEDRASHLYSLLARCKGEKTIQAMEEKVKIYGPSDEYEILMAKAIVYGKKSQGRRSYERAVKLLKKLNKYAILVSFMKEYGAKVGDRKIIEEAKKIENGFEYF